MSDRKQALQDLLAKIEAGAGQHGTDLPFWKVWTPESADGNIAYAAAKTFDGSLDAAKALHEAVLPKWLWGRMPSTDCMWVVPDTAGRERMQRSENKDPARAWLIAILKALIAQEPSND